MTTKAKFSKGFTLVEAIVVVGLFSLITGSLLSVFLTGHMVWNTGGASIDLQQQTRQGMNAMVRELHLSAQSRVNIINANTLAFQVPLNAAAAGGDGRSRIDVDGGGNLIWGAEATQDNWIEYSVVNNELRRRVLVGASSPQAVTETTLARDIQTVSFIADQVSANPSFPEGVEIILTASKGNSTCTLVTMVFFKN